MIKMDVSGWVDVIGSRVWFSQLDEYGIDSIFKTNQYLAYMFYAEHPIENIARDKVWVILEDVVVCPAKYD